MYTFREKFVRKDPTAKTKKNMYDIFRKWLDIEYPPNGCPTMTQWEELKKEDEAIDYGFTTNCRPNPDTSNEQEEMESCLSDMESISDVCTSPS